MKKVAKIRIGLAIVFSLMIPAASAFAYFTEINTNDGLVDANWSTSSLITDANGDISPSGADIIAARMVMDDPNPESVYLRADLGAALPDDYFLSGEFDCDNNGYFDDSMDFRIIYSLNSLFGTDVVRIEDGPGLFGGNLADIDLGEATGTNGVYEWQLPVIGMTETSAPYDLSACLTVDDTVYFRMVSYYLDPDSGEVLEQDATNLVNFDVPTAIKLSSIETSQGSWKHWPTIALIAVLLALGATGLVRKAWKRG